MEKLIYLLWKDPDTQIERVRDDLLGRCKPGLLEPTRGNFTVLIADVGDHLRSPVEPPLAAAVSFWLDSVDHRGPTTPAAPGRTATGARVSPWSP
jgi:hypothetical protein